MLYEILIWLLCENVDISSKGDTLRFSLQYRVSSFHSVLIRGVGSRQQTEG